MKHEVTFIHAADLHLDSPFKGLVNTPDHIFREMKESTFRALNRLIETAIEKQVDFILIAGDLFDNEKQSLKAQIRLKKAFERLAENGILVYLSYGNHDHIKGNVHKVKYASNVFIFPDETVRTFTFEKDGVPLASISGFSYVDRRVEVNKTSEYIADETKAHYHIAMLHGSVQGNKEHDTYAPFRISELTAKNFDYWALGHIHKRMVLKENPLIVYPGNTQGRHRKETGEKGCYYVRLTPTDSELTFIPLGSIEFTSVQIDVSDCKKVYELETLIQKEIIKSSINGPRLVDLTLISKQEALREWQIAGQLEEMIEVINETISSENTWQYIFRTAIEIQTVLEDQKAYYGEHFLGELNRQFNEGDISNFVKELFQHKQARKYLNPLDADMESEMKEVARVRLLDELLKGGAN